VADQLWLMTRIREEEEEEAIQCRQKIQHNLTKLLAELSFCCALGMNLLEPKS